MDNPYSFGRQLGSGVDGTVCVCTENATGYQYACKSINRSNSAAVLHAHAEIAMLERLCGHPNIIAYRDHFEDEDRLHIVMDLCQGGDLCDHLQEKGPLPERDAARILRAVVSAVAFCHERGVMHRDIKPENILLPCRNSGYENLKLADFGASADFSHDRCFNDVEGTPCYVAPEVLTGTGYDEKIDVWSLGVLFHVILSGYAPFDGDSETDIFRNIKRRSVNLNRSPWHEISAGAKDLLKGMLQKNPYRRLKLAQILAHPWMQGFVKHRSKNGRTDQDQSHFLLTMDTDCRCCCCC
ncbi:hypothetical protein KP509_25G020200 [Ceratopteris richardii]|uniref:Protein kinase domain-containing protein n=1 Tax=Ceratopteris richardii TaxID=49495 RepID=A0A8T2RQU6_CERRI|nr:hypothetical protein KP509_25G020200 [Ceratopteris richardii]